MDEFELERELTQCMARFPELERPRLVVLWNEHEFAGVWGHDYRGPVIVLVIPERLRQSEASIIRPILYHELAHAVNLESPDEVFYQRADLLSIALWRQMQAAGLLECSHGQVLKIVYN